MRLIPGALDTPDGRYSCYRSRFEFLDAVRIHVPEALVNLREMTAENDSGERIRTWARDWGLDADWVVVSAWFALQHWRQFPEAVNDASVWASSVGLGLSSPAKTDPPLYEPTLETLSQYIERIRAWEHQLVADDGFKRVGAKTSPEHFVWAARYQAGRAKIEHLAREAGVRRQTIKPAIDHVLTTIGLTPRRSAPGRPAK